MDTKALYSDIYQPDAHNYGSFGRSPEEFQAESRAGHQGQLISKYLVGLPMNATVLEVGCGLGHLNWVHRGWRGLEYSPTAVGLAKQLYKDLDIHEGDARDMPLESGSVDLLYSFAALEHIPQLERAFDEIQRVLKPGGVAVLSPAWNCRPWTVKKLQQRPYSELPVAEKIGKFLIPLRNNLVFRMLVALPKRLAREAGALMRQPFPLQYRPLHPRLELLSRYPHISDDDAFVDIDAHAAMVYFRSRGWEVRSHASFLRRIACRGEEVVVVKPSADATSAGKPR